MTSLEKRFACEEMTRGYSALGWPVDKPSIRSMDRRLPRHRHQSIPALGGYVNTSYVNTRSSYVAKTAQL
jgi:hypothetical protein